MKDLACELFEDYHDEDDDEEVIREEVLSQGVSKRKKILGLFRNLLAVFRFLGFRSFCMFGCFLKSRIACLQRCDLS